MGWTEYVERTKDIYNILIGEPQRKRPFETEG